VEPGLREVAGILPGGNVGVALVVALRLALVRLVIDAEVASAGLVTSLESGRWQHVAASVTAALDQFNAMFEARFETE
jgi:hypothetical protein